jgi:IS30 family transposase
MPWFAILRGLTKEHRRKEHGMERAECSRKGKHLTREERVVIERMSRGGRPPRDIADVLGRHVRTIERELERGRVKHLDSELRVKMVYSSDRGQDVHDLNATARGPDLKLGANRELVDFVRERIVKHKESPDVVAFRMREAGLPGAVCTKTLYNYIDQGLIAGVSNETLWEKRQRRNAPRRTLRRSRKRPEPRQSIEKRPEHVLHRKEFGHWEMDLIVGPTGGSNAALLTLVERKTRHVICRKIPDKTQASVLRAIRAIESQFGTRRFRSLFKSITADNGSEFLDVQSLQTSAFSQRQRTTLFYAHPYAAWERGSNENANRIIRRFIAKGRDIARFTHKAIEEVVRWINNYPRRILQFMTPQQLFSNHTEAIA